MPRRLILAAIVCAAACARRVPHVAIDASAAACRQASPPSAITWISPTDERDRHRLAAWCEAVGPILFEPQPQHTAALAIDRLVVISWNTHVGGGDVGRVVAGVERGDFTDGVRVNAVVLVLQEAYRHGDAVPEQPSIHAAFPGRIVADSHQVHAHDIRRVARELGLALLYAPSMRNGIMPGDPEDRGNAILSTVPLAGPEAIELPIERQRRVAAVATISGATSTGRSWRLRIADVHLDTALAWTSGGPRAARARQADALVQALQSTDADVPTVVAGDFNTVMGPGEPAIRVLRRAFPDATTPAGPTWRGPLGLHTQLDYVFARGVRSIRVRRLAERFGSDHYPLLADIRF